MSAADDLGTSSDLLNGDNWAPEAPEERKEQEDKENARLTSSVGVIQEILDWFDANQRQYESVDALNIDEKSTGEDVRVAVLLAKKLKAAFEVKASTFRRDFAKYLQEDELEQ